MYWGHMLADFIQVEYGLGCVRGGALCDFFDLMLVVIRLVVVFVQMARRGVGNHSNWASGPDLQLVGSIRGEIFYHHAHTLLL